MLIPFDAFYEEYTKGYAINLETHKKLCMRFADKPEAIQWSVKDLNNIVAVLEVGEGIAHMARNLAIGNTDKPDHFDRDELQKAMEASLVNAALDLSKGSYSDLAVARVANWGRAVHGGYSYCNAANAALKTVEWHISEAERVAKNRKYWWRIRRNNCDMWRTNYGGVPKYTRAPIKAAMWKWDELPKTQHNERYDQGAEIGQ